MSQDANLIQPTNGGRDAFVHVTAVRVAGLNGLDDGRKVIFEVVAERGEQAAAKLSLDARSWPIRNSPPVRLAQRPRDTDGRSADLGDGGLQPLRRDAPLVAPPDDLRGLAHVHLGALPR